MEDPENESIFDSGLSYFKAAWILHMLRHIVGDSTFFQILKTYAITPMMKYGTATTEDFQALCEQVADKNLNKFFRQWIYDEWYPEYVYFWQGKELGEEKYQVSGIIKQVQKRGPIFEMPLDLTILTDAGDTTIVFLDDEQVELFEFVVNAKPSNMLIDKDNWILKTAIQIEVPKPEFLLKNYIIDDSKGNRDGHVDPGESINLTVEIENQGITAMNVELLLATDYPDIKVINGTNYFNQIDMGAVVNNQLDPFIFSTLSTIEGSLCKFKLCLAYDSIYQDSLSFYIPIGSPEVLVVDDDAGVDYEKYIKIILDNCKIFYDTWDVQTQGLPDISDNYQILIWFTGDDRQSTLTNEEQSLLTAFLDNGRRLLISGQNIGYDLIEDGSATDSLFFTNYLHATYTMDDADDFRVFGISNEPLGSRLYIYLEGDHGGVGNQNSTDVINPIDPARSFLYYAMVKHSVGIFYEDQANRYRIVYLPFGLEGIAGPNEDSAEKLVDRVISWLSASRNTGIIEQSFSNQKIYHLYPNPFNPETKIKFDLPEKTRVVLRIYNVLGQEVITLLDAAKQPGTFEITWDGKNKAGKNMTSGIYFYKLETNKFHTIHKMMKMN